MRSGRGDGQLRPPGFPIRTSSDHSLVADSPRLIAGSNVLHRLLVPRHPPCALKNLATFNCRCTTRQHSRAANLQEEDARVHCAVLKIRTALGPATACAVERPSPSRSPQTVFFNTVSGFLRTQQRAHSADLPGSSFRPLATVL